VGGVSFDRAASFYDATRGLPEDVGLALAGMLAAQLGSRGTSLEIGVGTGRIALPLNDLGISIVGTDISAAMLDRLVANAATYAGVASHPPGTRVPSPTGPNRPPFPVLRADATDLPLVAASFGAVMASHVLHLIPAWRDAVDEAIRVLRPGGLLLVDFGGNTPAPWRSESFAVLAAHGIAPVRPGVNGPVPLAEYLGSRATMRQLPAVEMTAPRSLGQDVDEWEHQIHAWTWPYDAGQMRTACNAVRDWAAREGWSTEAQVDVTSTIQWWAFELTDRAD
jgi:ubiquinone/menaquinone biosynthesis C-methylase UbiE